MSSPAKPITWPYFSTVSPRRIGRIASLCPILIVPGDAHPFADELDVGAGRDGAGRDDDVVLGPQMDGDLEQRDGRHSIRSERIRDR